MALAALLLFCLYLLLAFGVRTVLMVRRTGTSGFHGVSGRPGSAEWLGGVSFAVALALGLAAPAADLAGISEPLAVLDGDVGHAAGLVLAASALALSLWAQATMGASWRIGVADGDQTDLVCDGPFARVRNPFFAALIPLSIGLVLLVPNVLALLAGACLVLALQLQTRVVEEPYLLRTHGDAYRAYAARTGRFLPGLGRLRTEVTR